MPEEHVVYPQPVFAVDIHRYDGIFIGSINNLDTHPAGLPIKRGAGVIELHIPKLELSHSVYFLSLKAYTQDGSPAWDDPALNLAWPCEAPVLSERDRTAGPFAELVAALVERGAA